MKEHCPVNYRKMVNENAVRIVGGIVFLIIVIFIFTKFTLLPYFLILDFAIRGFYKQNYSVLCTMSKFIVKLMGKKPDMINSGPKVFAAKIGFIVSCLVLISFYLFNTYISTIFSVILAICAGLEAFFGYCLACKVYPMVYRIKNDYRNQG